MPKKKTTPSRASQLGLKGLGSVILPEWRPGKLSDEGYTPRVLLDPIEALAPIDTDPCWSPYSLVRPMAYAWTIQHDGTTRPWWGHVFMNTPFSAFLPFWRRAATWVSAGNRLTAVSVADPTPQWCKGIANKLPGFYVDVDFRVEFHRPFAPKTQRAGHTRDVTRVWSFGFELEDLLRANFHRLGNIQPTGGLQRWMDR